MSFLPNCLVVVLVLGCIVAQSQAQAPDFLQIAEILQRCRRETGATNEDIQALFMRRVPETRSGQCLLACAGEGLGVMHQGKLDTEGTIAMAGRVTQGRDQRIQDAVRNGILACAQEAAASGAQDSCVAAAQLASCGINTAHRVSTTFARIHKDLKPFVSSKPTLNGVEDGDSYPSSVNSMKTLHSKSSSHYYQTNTRVRRQLGNILGFSSQPTPYVPPVQQTYPVQQTPYQQYPVEQTPYPLQQTNPINPIDQSIGRAVDPLNPAYNYPYTQPYPYAQPVVVTPLLRGKRSPQEIFLTEAEIDLPPEVVHRISERLRELLLALTSAQDGQSFNSTDVTEKDAEVIESVTSTPRKRRQTSPQNQQGEGPLGQILGLVRNGPIHQMVRNMRNIMTDPASEKSNATAPSTAAPAPAA